MAIAAPSTIILVLTAVFGAMAITSLVLAGLAYKKQSEPITIQGSPGPPGARGPQGPRGLPGEPLRLSRFDEPLHVENIDNSFDRITAHGEGWWDPYSGVGQIIITGEMQAKVPDSGSQLDFCRVHLPHRLHWVNWPGHPENEPHGDHYGQHGQNHHHHPRHFDDFGVDHFEIFSGTRSHHDLSFNLDVENFEVQAELAHDIHTGYEDTVLDFAVESASTDISTATGEPGFTWYEVVISLTPPDHCRRHDRRPRCCEDGCKQFCRWKKHKRCRDKT